MLGAMKQMWDGAGNPVSNRWAAVSSTSGTITNYVSTNNLQYINQGYGTNNMSFSTINTTGLVTQSVVSSGNATVYMNGGVGAVSANSSRCSEHYCFLS